MKIEIPRLEDQQKKDLWEKERSDLESKLDIYSKKIDNLENLENIIDNDEKEDYLDIDTKIDHGKLTSEQAMKRGDKLVNTDRNILENAARTVNVDGNTIIEVNKELERQIKELDNVDKDLVEIDFSLNRARKKITDMFKMYSKDKCIIWLIVAILIIIVTIIITSACGGDSKNNFNVPHDIFFSNNKTTNSSNYLFGPFNFMIIISLILLYLL